MSAFDASEVLQYLNELGYRNISAKQLKEFMRDLKKLIKYDGRSQEKTQKIAEEINKRDACTATSCPDNRFVPNSLLAPTESSKAKEVCRKEQIVSVQIKGPARICHCVNCNPKNTNKHSFHSSTLVGSQASSNSRQFYSDVAEGSSQQTAASPKRPKSCDVDCRKSKVKCNSNSLRPKASYIVPRRPIKICKTDPVALYHKYQELWKKQKLPGEDNHSNLRWAIRERMLGQPQTMSAAPSMEVIATRRKTTSRL